MLTNLTPKFYFNSIKHHHVRNHKNRHVYILHANPTFSYPIKSSRTRWHNQKSKMDFVMYSNDQAGDLIPLSATFLDSWTIWLPGILVTIILPFFTTKWGPFAKFKERVDNVVDRAEEVADIIEAVANEVDKVAEEISDGLPVGGKLRETADFVENAAERIAKDAHWIGDIIDKVEEVEEKVESLIERDTDEHATKVAKIGLPNSNTQQVDKN